MWKQIILKLLNGEKDIPSPFDRRGTIKSVFVVLDVTSKMGFMWAWCSETHRGISMSRMKIPDGLDYVTSDEFSRMSLPKIKFEDPIR